MDSSGLIEDHLFLAELIAFDYANIPGCRWGDACSEANLALMRAARAYDPGKGEFIPFAARAIRNGLNTLYAKQLRMSRIFPKSLDEPVRGFDRQDDPSSADILDHRAAPEDVQKQVRQREAGSAIASVMNLLTPRERMVVEAIRLGRSYSELGDSLGITKQAAHKSARAALDKLRSGLERLGFQGIASDGLLASRGESSPKNARVDDFPPDL